jgi:hypothetical protein
VVATVSTWRNCLASVYLLKEVNTRWPDRDKASDGTIGDPAHSARVSDHNPNSAGVVRARDIDEDLGRDALGQGKGMAWLVAHLRQLAIGGDPRLNGGGYIIYEGRICGGSKGWDWRPYTGNPHTKHAHISFSRNAAAYDSRAPWGISKPFTAPKPPNPGDLDMDEKTLRRIVGEEIDKRVNPDGKGNLLVRIRDSVAATERRVVELVTGARPR